MNTLKIADIPDIRVRGGDEVPAFRVTKTELAVIARYWTWVYLDIDTDRFLSACIGSTWRNFFPYACRRMDAAGVRIGVERYRDLTQDIDERFRSSLGERRWDIYRRGNKEEWDAVRDEVYEELDAQESRGESDRPRLSAPAVVREASPLEDPADHEDEFLKALREARAEGRPTPWGPDPLVFGHARRGLRIDYEEQSGFVPNMDELTVLAAFWGTVLVEAALGQPGGASDRTCGRADGMFAEQRVARLLNLIGRDWAATAAAYVHEWASAELGERCHQLFPGGATAKEPAEWLELWTALYVQRHGADSGVPSARCDQETGKT